MSRRRSVARRLPSPAGCLPLLAALVPLLLSLPVPPGSAQVPVQQPLPWAALADTSRASFVFAAERLSDPALDWTVDGLGLTAIWGRGGTRLFARERLLSFSTGRARVLDRWPALRGPDAGPDWPDESQVSGWGRPEVGVLTGLGLPLRSDLALAVGLPFGRDELYPFSSASVPLRLQVRSRLDLAAGLSVAALYGGTLRLDSGREVLTKDAFPSGWNLGLALLRASGAGGELALETETAGDRSLLQARLDWWLRLGPEQALRLRWIQVLGGREDRPFRTGLSLAWRVGLPVAAEAAGERKAGPAPGAASPAGVLPGS